MTTDERETGSHVLVVHEINSVVFEEVNPMLKNVKVQTMRAINDNHKMNRGLVEVGRQLSFDSYHGLLLTYRENMRKLLPTKLRPVARREIAVINGAIADIDETLAQLARI